MTRACVRNIIIYVLIKNLFALICNEFAYREEEEKMTLKDCYMQMGADYEETVQRLRSESLIQRIILNFRRIRAIRSFARHWRTEILRLHSVQLIH